MLTSINKTTNHWEVYS